jgi:hypothetical protein
MENPKEKLDFELLDPTHIPRFKVSVKFFQSFSETEILRKFHEIYDFSEIYGFRRHRSSARAVPGRGQVSNIGCTGYISTEHMKFM